MTSDEKKTIKQIKEELVVMRLQTKVMTETEFKKILAKIIRLVESLDSQE